MAKLPRFLVTPVWKKLSRSYATLKSPQIRRFFGLPIVKRSLKISLLTLATYLLLVVFGAIGTYHFKSSNFFTHFTESIFPYPAAMVRGESIPLSRFRMEVSARKHYAEVQKIAYTDTEIDQFVINQLVSRKIFAQVLKENKLMVSEEELDQRMKDITSQAGGEDKLKLFLKEQYGDGVDLATFRIWMHEAAVESAIQQQLLVHAELKHILVAAPAGSAADVVEKARLKAVEIRTSITDSATFSDVAKARSEDVASRDKGGDFGTTNRGDEQPILSEAFEKAAFTTPVGQISEPVLTSFGWHIVLVVKREGSIDLGKKTFLNEELKRGRISRFVGDKA